MLIYKKEEERGFTVVELLIVMVVIVILAGIALLAFNGVTAKARDSTRKSDVEQFGKIMSAYALRNDGNWLEKDSGCGHMGDGSGWISVDSSGQSSYKNSILSCLEKNGLLSGKTFTDPSGCASDSGGKCGKKGESPTTAYMKATCTKNGTKSTYIFARLESENKSPAEIDNLCDPNTMAGFSSSDQKFGTDYGMNYYILVN